MTHVLEWPATNPADLLALARQHLAAGQVVVVPSDLGYEAVGSALRPAAVAALARLANARHPLAVVLNDALEIFDWLPFFRGTGLRFMRRFWPGPLVVAGMAGIDHGLVRELPAAVRPFLAKDTGLAIRLPEHAALRDLARGNSEPLAACPCPTADPAAWPTDRADDIGLVIKDMSALSPQAPTLVKCNGREWSVIRVGAISAKELEEAAPCRIVFVCTGNTCRSPLAEAFCKKLLGEQLGCTPSELTARGFCVASAGLGAVEGAEATPEAVAVAQAMHVDLSRHRSQPLYADLLADADSVVTMTYSQLRLVRALSQGAAPRLLSSRFEDIDDPIGCSPDVYEECAHQIHGELVELIPELLEA